jgi:hypothetical protein
MSETDHEYRLLVEQKMQVRAERNARLRRAEQEAQEREASEAQAAQERAEQDRQKLAEQMRQREAAAEARRDRLTLIAKYKADPGGIRHIATLRQVCIHCGSERVQQKSASAPHVQVCTECWAMWYVNHCWSCETGWLDSRDPDTPACKMCRRIKCAVCGACNRNGCSTNPYTADHRHCDVEAA